MPPAKAARVIVITPKQKRKEPAPVKAKSNRGRKPVETAALAEDGAQRPDQSGSPDRRPAAPTETALLGSDRAWKIAQLAAILVSNMDMKERSPVGMRVNPQLSTKAHDPMFASALKRADSLLSWAEGQGGDIYAYQIFEEGERQTEKEMADRFKAWNWEHLQAKESITKLMGKIRLRFEEELSAAADRYDKIVGVGVRELQDEITGSVRECFTKHFRQPVEDFDSQLATVVESITSLIGERLYEHFATGLTAERFDSFQRVRLFMQWCFPTPTKGERAERLFLPHEIFRRCAARSWFNNSLMISRGKLTPALIPFPPDDLRREVFPLFEDQAEREMADARSARSKDDDEPKLAPMAAS